MQKIENYTSKKASAAKSLIEVLRQRGETEGDRCAYTFLVGKGNQSDDLTYAELDRKARAIAAVLQDLNARGQRALLLYPPGLDYIAGFFGCLYAGVIAVPAYPPNPNQLQRTLARLHAIVRDAEATLVLTTSQIQNMMKLLKFKSRVSGSLGKIVSWKKREDASAPDHADGVETEQLFRMHWLATDSIDDHATAGWREPVVDAETLAFLQYTSGSTGAPKGVMVSHGNLLHNSKLIHAGFGFVPESDAVIWLPIYHDMGLIGGVLQPLVHGYHGTLMSPLTFLQRPYFWLQTISKLKDKRVASGGPNFAFDLCLRKITSEQRKTLDLRHWEVAFCGAEPIRAQTVERFTEAFAECGFRREAFYPCYGLAEATLFVSGVRKSDPPKFHTVEKQALENNRIVSAGDKAKQAHTLVGSGRALLDQKIAIVHPETRTRCAPDEVGEIWVASPSIAKGYWNRPEESEQTFRAFIADTGEGPFLRTGDLGYLHEGELFVTGRLKDLIIIRGVNYYPQDIELTVENSHSNLRPGCGAAFSVDADGQERLVVVQEVRSVKALDAKAIIDAIRSSVNEAHELQVFDVVLIQPRTIPKTSSGKIQRRACRQAYRAGTLDIVAHDKLQPEADGADAPASTPPELPIRQAVLSAAPERRPQLLQEYLRRQTAHLLNVKPERIELQTPFSTLGLDSLATMELLEIIEDDLKIELPMENLTSDATIAYLTERVLATFDGKEAPAIVDADIS